MVASKEGILEGEQLAKAVQSSAQATQDTQITDEQLE